MKYGYFVLWFWFPILSVWQTHAGMEQATRSPLRILEEYAKLSDIVNQWNGNLEIRSQRMLVGEITDSFKKDMEGLYAFSFLNPIYREYPVLYYKSHATIDWKCKIQSNQMRGKIVIQETNTHLFDTFPTLHTPDRAILRRLNSQIPVPHPFALLVDATQVETNISSFILPHLVVDWHYLPRLWYPPLSKIGCPSDFSLIKTQLQDNHSLVYLFSPQNIDNHLLLYFRTLSGNPDLVASDLTAILLIDFYTMTCRSFTITLESDGKRRPIFSITHSDPDRLAQSLPIPSLSTIMTSYRVTENKQPVWNTNYFIQMQITSITDL